MIWLEADAIIRQQTSGAKGLDDFARAFFGINPGDWGQVVYNRGDVIRTLNQVAPYDWAGFFQKYVDGTTKERSEEHTSELQSLMRISYAVFCLKKKKHK